MIRLVQRRSSQGRRSAISKWEQALKASHTPEHIPRLAILAQVAYGIPQVGVPHDLTMTPPELAAVGSHKSEAFFKWGWGQIRTDQDLIEDAPEGYLTVFKAIHRWWDHHRRLRRPLELSDGSRVKLDDLTMKEAWKAAKHWRQAVTRNWQNDLTLAPLALSTEVLRTKHGIWYEIQDPFGQGHLDARIAQAVGRANGHCYGTHVDSYWHRISAQGDARHPNNRYLYQLYADAPGAFLGALSIAPDGCEEDLHADEHTREGTLVPMGHYGATLADNQWIRTKPHLWEDFWEMLEHRIGKMRELENGTIYIPQQGTDRLWLGNHFDTNWHANHPHYLRIRGAKITEWMTSAFAPDSAFWQQASKREKLGWLHHNWVGAARALPESLAHQPEILNSSLFPALKQEYPPQVKGGELYIPVEAILPRWWPARAATLLEEAKEVAQMDLRRLPPGKMQSWPRRSGSPLPEPSPPRTLPLPRDAVSGITLKSPGRSGQHFIVLSPGAEIPNFNRAAHELMETYFEAAIIAWKAQYKQAMANARRRS